MKTPSIKWVILLAILVRATWVFASLQHPSSDDVQYGLMAEAIRSHQSFPLIAWGIGYGGTITTSWVLAGLFSLFGPSLLVLFTYGAVLSLVQVVLWIKIAERLHSGSGAWVGLLLAVPSAHMAVMMQQLSYADSLVIGAVLAWCVVRWCGLAVLSLKQSFIVGALSGYLFYTHPIPTVFAATLLLFWRKGVRLSIPFSLAGLFMGIAPLIFANLTMRGITLRRIGARMLNMSAKQFLSEGSGVHLAGRLIQQWRVGIQAQPKLIAEAFSSEAGLTFIGIAAALGFVVLIMQSRRAGNAARWVAWPVIIASLAGNAVFGQNARARFLMPAYTCGMLLAGTAAELGGFPAQAVALSVALLNSAGTWRRMHELPAGVSYESAVAYLKQKGMRYGYADFWQSLPLTFVSHGALEVASTATDARGFWDRTAHITQQVDRAQDVFYVFDESNASQRPFIRAFEIVATQNNITYEKANIPPLRIYSRLSRPVRPQELDAVLGSAGSFTSGAGK